MLSSLRDLKDLKKLRKLKELDPLEFLIELDKNVRSLDAFLKAVDSKVKSVDARLKTFGVLPPQQSQQAQSQTESTKSTKSEDFLFEIRDAINKIKAARIEVECPHIRNILEEIEVFGEEKLEDIEAMLKGRFGKTYRAAKEVLDKEKIEDWTKLSEEEKQRLKQKIKQKMEQLS